MRPLRILLCSNDAIKLEQFVQALNDDGVSVHTSTQLVDTLRASQHGFDLLLVDMDGLSSFLRSLLPSLSQSLPTLPIIGVSTRSIAEMETLCAEHDLVLDDYLFGIPRPEELIVRFPNIAAKYVCDTGTLATLEPALS